MYQAYVERGSATSKEDVAQFAELLGHEPRTYGNYAEELARQWVAISAAEEAYDRAPTRRFILGKKEIPKRKHSNF
jgi:hypothetical protein